MSEVEILDSNPSIGNEDLCELEERFGFVFPDDMRRFYLLANGGRPVPNLFPKNGEYFSVHEFLPIKHGMHGELFEDTYADLIEDGDFFSRPSFPFATDSGVDYFYCNLEPGKVGEIWFYQSDYFDDPSRAVVHLAGSLDEFMRALVTE